MAMAMAVAALGASGAVNAQEPQDEIEALRREVQALGEQLRESRASLESRQAEFEERLQRGGDELFGRLSAVESTEQALRRQLELRVPSYDAFPESVQRELVQTLELQKRLESLIIFHGYARSGFGSNGRGGGQVAFQAPGAPAKYRLGNEADTYVELALDKDWSKNPGGPVYRGELMIAMQTQQNASFDPDNEFLIRQIYAEGTNFAWIPDAKFWVGERYYDRHDIHINDFFFLDMSGYGGGVTGVDVGCGKLDAAYLGGTLEQVVTDRGEVTGHNMDIRLQDVDVPLGKGIFWLNLAITPGGVLPGGQSIETSRGVATGFIHVSDAILGGFNKAAILWGEGAASDFSTGIADPLLPVNDSSQLLITETLTIQPNDCLTMQLVAIARRIDNGAAVASRIDWYSAGLRPIVHLTEYWAVAFEYGADYVDNEQLGVSGTVHKFTVAPQLRSGNQFFSRPSLRTYFTYAAWPDDLRGLVGADVYAQDTAGFSMGCQLETWW